MNKEWKSPLRRTPERNVRTYLDFTDMELFRLFNVECRNGDSVVVGNSHLDEGFEIVHIPLWTFRTIPPVYAPDPEEVRARAARIEAHAERIENHFIEHPEDRHS